MLTVYGTFKFLHVAAAIIWVGGIIALAVLNARLAREGNAAALMGARFSFWLAWGLAGVLGSLALGPLFLRPASQRLAALAVRENDARIAGARRRLAVLGAVNVGWLLSTVWAMVTKPTL